MHPIVSQPEDAWEFAQSIYPDLTLIHASHLRPDLANLINEIKALCGQPILAIVTSEEDRKTAYGHGADRVVIEGLPSSKLAAHIAALLQHNSDSNTNKRHKRDEPEVLRKKSNRK